MNINLPLWADMEDTIKIIVAILFVLLPLVAKAINMFSNQAEPAKRPAPPPIPPAAKPRIPPKAANPELNSEVEEFLRRAAERRTSEQRREVTTAAQRHEPPRPEQSRPEQPPARRTPRPPPAEQAKPQPRKISRQPLQAEIVDDVKRGSDVAEHVKQHFKPHAVLERAPSAQAVDQADEAMQDHMHAVFDHQVGTLSRGERGRLQPTEPQAMPQRAPSDLDIAALAGLLSNPQSVRQAIVLNEILSRPEHRW